MNTLESLIELKSGESICKIKDDGIFYKIKDGKVRAFDKVSFEDKYPDNPESLVIYIGTEQLYDDETWMIFSQKNENGLGLNIGNLFNGGISFAILGSKSDEINKAIAIYKEFLSHPLVAKSTDQNEQYFIMCDGRESILIGDYCNVSVKIDLLSPSFNTEEDALAVIKYFGEEKLLFMFKTLKGIE